MKTLLTASLATLALTVGTSASAMTGSDTITKQDVIDAQTTWGNGIVAISTVHAEGGDYKKRAKKHIKKLYAYEETDVMFKPTCVREKWESKTTRSPCSACSIGSVR